MYATIYDAVKDIFGWNIPFLKLLQSFGFFVAISFLLCAWVFAKELNRKESLGFFKPSFRKVKIGMKATPNDLVTQFAFGFLIGWKFIGMLFIKGASADPRAYMLSGQGNLLIGLLLGAVFAGAKWYFMNKSSLPEPKEADEKVSAGDHVGNMTLLAAAFGFLGAKIFHILENFRDLLADPSGMLFSFSGLTMYGGLIVGGAAVLVYSRKKGFGLLHVMDACAPGLLLAYGVGRLGCQVAGDGDWGIVNRNPQPGWLHFLPKWTWAYDYPNNVNHTCNPFTDTHSAEYIMAQLTCDPEAPRLAAPVYPTPLYEATIMIVMFAFFWIYRKKFTTPGRMFSLYLICNGVERFFVELIRVNTTLFHIGSFHVTQAEFIAFILFATGMYGIWWTKKYQRNTIPPPEAA